MTSSTDTTAFYSNSYSNRVATGYTGYRLTGSEYYRLTINRSSEKPVDNPGLYSPVIIHHHHHLLTEDNLLYRAVAFTETESTVPVGRRNTRKDSSLLIPGRLERQFLFWMKSLRQRYRYCRTSSNNDNIQKRKSACLFREDSWASIPFWMKSLRQR